MPRGEQRVEAEGINGEQTLRWLVTFAGGRQTDRRLIDSTITRQPQHRVIAFGSQGMRPGREPGRQAGRRRVEHAAPGQLVEEAGRVQAFRGAR